MKERGKGEVEIKDKEEDGRSVVGKDDRNKAKSKRKRRPEEWETKSEMGNGKNMGKWKIGNN